MNETNQVVGQNNAEGQQLPPMPSDETKPVENSIPSSTTGNEEVNSAQFSERTAKQIEKLLEKNKELSEKLKRYEVEKSTSLFDMFDSGASKQMSYDKPVVEDYTDDFGDVDAKAYNKAMRDQQQKVEQALNIARQTQQELQRRDMERQEREAYAKFPWLDPTSPYKNDDAIELVKAKLVMNYANGVQADLSDVASSVARFVQPTPAQEVDARNTASKELSEAKKLANAPVRGTRQTTSSIQSSDLVDLRNRSLKGDREALAERLRRATSY